MPHASFLAWQHIPQFLPEPWLQQHFDVPAHLHPILRHALPVHLVQMLSGGTQRLSAHRLYLTWNTAMALPTRHAGKPPKQASPTGSSPA
ncbi:hypothetical protein ABZ926_08830 [Streptomyces litmocidini]|uniref:hypothetical protein n=1 Tax=Streptomyces litmocidini TaxID=67318 RepID=UPI0033ECE90F